MKRGVPWLYLFLAVGGLALDQGVKAWVRASLFEGQVLARPFPGVFELKLTYNHGIAFGLMSGMGYLFAPIALLIAAGTAYYALKHPREYGIGMWANGLLCAGAVGNLIDRVWMGKVTDMFWFRPINFPVFNVADTWITVAAVLLMITSMLPEKKLEEAATSTVETEVGSQQ